VNTILKFCPKCNGFSDDEDLRFCLADGVPLVALDRTDDKWTEGDEVVRQERQRLRREVRRSTIKRALSTLVTTVLIVMVVTVVALNVWIYLGETGDEGLQEYVAAQTLLPGGDADIEPVPPGGSTPVTKPTPRTETTPEIPPAVSPSASPQETGPSPAPSPTVIAPKQCSAETRHRAEQRVEAEYGNSWRAQFLSTRETVRNKYTPAIFRSCQIHPDPARCKIFVEHIDVGISEAPINKSVTANADCTTVTASITYQWEIRLPQATPIRVAETRTFPYKFK